MMNNVQGSRVITANGDYKLCAVPTNTVGTLTLDVVNNAFSGTIKVKLLGATTPEGVAPRLCIFQRADTSGDIAANTALTMDMIHYIRMDGANVWITVSAYASGSCTLYWTWSQG